MPIQSKPKPFSFQRWWVERTWRQLFLGLSTFALIAATTFFALLIFANPISPVPFLAVLGGLIEGTVLAHANVAISLTVLAAFTTILFALFTYFSPKRDFSSMPKAVVPERYKDDASEAPRDDAASKVTNTNTNGLARTATPSSPRAATPTSPAALTTDVAAVEGSAALPEEAALAETTVTGRTTPIPAGIFSPPPSSVMDNTAVAGVGEAEEVKAEAAAEGAEAEVEEAEEVKAEAAAEGTEAARSPSPFIV